MGMEFIKQLIVAAIQKQIDELLEAKRELKAAIHDLEQVKKKYSTGTSEASQIVFTVEKIKE